MAPRWGSKLETNPSFVLPREPPLVPEPEGQGQPRIQFPVVLDEQIEGVLVEVPPVRLPSQSGAGRIAEKEIAERPPGVAIEEVELGPGVHVDEEVVLAELGAGLQ